MTKKHWIPKNLKKGRCTPMGTKRCPVGSPQYNLAKTFKKHHGFHKKEEGGLTNEPNIPKAAKGFWAGAEDVGMGLLDTTPLGIASGVMTGKSLSDNLGYKEQTGVGRTFDKITDTAAGAEKQLAPIAAGAVAGAFGLPPQLGSSAMSGLQSVATGINNQYNSNAAYDPTQAQYGQAGQQLGQLGGQGMQMYNMASQFGMFADGGASPGTLIEVEGNELETTNGQILKDFNKRPKHTKGGFTYLAKPNRTIIPSKLRQTYLEGDKRTRQTIEANVIADQLKRNEEAQHQNDERANPQPTNLRSEMDKPYMKSGGIPCKKCGGMTAYRNMKKRGDLTINHFGETEGIFYGGGKVYKNGGTTSEPYATPEDDMILGGRYLEMNRYKYGGLSNTMNMHDKLYSPLTQWRMKYGGQTMPAPVRKWMAFHYGKNSYGKGIPKAQDGYTTTDPSQTQNAWRTRTVYDPQGYDNILMGDANTGYLNPTNLTSQWRTDYGQNLTPTPEAFYPTSTGRQVTSNNFYPSPTGEYPGRPSFMSMKNQNVTQTETPLDIQNTFSTNTGEPSSANKIKYGSYGGNNVQDWSNLQKAGYYAATAAPIAYNLYKGFSKPDYITDQEAGKYQNPEYNRIKSLMANRNINMKPIEDEIKDTYNIGLADVTSGYKSSGQALSGRTALYGQRMNALAKAKMEAQDANNRYRGEEASALAPLGQQYADRNWEISDWNSRARANRNRFLATGLEQGSDLAQGLNRDDILYNPAGEAFPSWQYNRAYGPNRGWRYRQSI